MNTSLEQLQSLLDEHRISGDSFITFQKRSDGNRTAVITEKIITDEINLFVQSLGYNSIDERWIELDFQVAETLLITLLCKDLANHQQVMSPPHADKITASFFSLFLKNTRFFSNREPYTDDNFQYHTQWHPISEEGLDCGILGIDDNSIGMLWIEDYQ